MLQSVGDVELQSNIIIPWDAEDFKTGYFHGDVHMVATGPKFMIVHVGHAWIEMDVLVSHAHHFFDTKHERERNIFC